MTNYEVIIPTLKRPDHLRRCIASLAKQVSQPLAVYVGVREDDQESVSVLEEFDSVLVLKPTLARGVGVVGSMNSCLAQTVAPLVVLLDDDVEIPPHWAKRMIDLLASAPAAVGVGGRDLLQDHPEMRVQESLVLDVGRFHWYGRIVGNHHRGGGAARAVHVLRGSNCMFRGDFLRRMGIEKGLRGKGAQVNWEIAIGLQALNEGMHVIYEPNILVIHHVAPRHDNDLLHRGVFNAESVFDVAHNESLVVLKHGRGFRRFAMLFWQFMVGSPICPGFIRLPGLIAKEPKIALQKFSATIRGRLDSWMSFVRKVEHAS